MTAAAVPASDVVGIVLGAGSSRRLGRPKQLLPLGATTVLNHSVATACQSSLARVIVVLGGSSAAVSASLTPGRYQVVYNDAYGTGCASSLLAGLDAAGPEAPAIALLLGDMPGVTPAVIDTVLEKWAEVPNPWAAVTSYRDGLGHPFLFSASSFPTLRGLHGDKAVWKIVDGASPDQVRRLPVDVPLPPDIDTWDDYVTVCASFGLPHPGPDPGPDPGQVPQSARDALNR